MFWLVLWRLLNASRGRLVLALVIVASGAAVCAALLNLDLDATDKLTREFRALGANLVVSAPQIGDAPATLDGAVMDQIEELRLQDREDVAPYLYLSAQAEAGARRTPVIVAGTWFDKAVRMNSWWKVEGNRIVAHD